MGANVLSDRSNRYRRLEASYPLSFERETNSQFIWISLRIRPCRILLEARMLLEFRFHSRPSKSVTKPPASCTINASPAKSHGVELLSRKASQAPDARYPMSEPATRVNARQ